MTIEERKERFFKFEGCLGSTCAECSYGGCGPCKDAIYEDARAILKDMADKHLEDEIKTIVAANKPPVYEAPLTAKDRERILETIRLKTEVPDLSAHFIQEINELCANLNNLAALVGKREQLLKGTDPTGFGIEDDFLVGCINVSVADVIAEAADVYNYLWAIGYSHKLERFRENVDEKLARWANRLNGVSDE